MFRYSLLLGCLTLLAPTVHAERFLDLYHVALQNDPELQAARQAQQAAQAGREFSQAQLMPTLGLHSEVTGLLESIEFSEVRTQGRTPDYDDNYFTQNHRLELKYPLLDRQDTLGITVAETRIRVAEAEVAKIRQNAMLRFAERYFEVLSTLGDIAANHLDRAATDKALDEANTRLNAEQISPTELQAAQTEFSFSLLNETAYQNAHLAAIDRLQAVLGQAPQSLQPLKETIPLRQPTPDNPGEWLTTAQQNNPSLLAQRARVAVAHDEIAYGQAADAPQVDLVVGYQYKDNLSTTIAFAETQANGGYVGIRLNAPLYTGGRTTSKQRQNVATHAQQLAVGVQVERELDYQIRSLYFKVGESILRAKATKQGVFSSETAMKTRKVDLEADRVAEMDYLKAKAAYQLARVNAEKARYQHLLAHLRLKQAAGVLAEADFETLASYFEDTLLPLAREVNGG